MRFKITILDNILKRIEGTTKKSIAAISVIWLLIKVFQLCDGGFRLFRLMIPDTDRSDISIPSFSNSPWIRGAPHIGLDEDNFSTRDFTSASNLGRPGLAPPDFWRQYNLNARLCQRITVAGCTITNESRQLGQTLDNTFQNTRSRSFNCGLLWLRFKRLLKDRYWAGTKQIA